jgi:hypothetical protein
LCLSSKGARPDENGCKKKAHDVQTLDFGVLVDPAEKAVFVPKAEGGIEAVEIATGNTLWQTPKEDGTRWAVAVHGRTLVVRVHDWPLRVAGMDLDAKGKTLWTTEPVLPDWIQGPEWVEGKRRRPRVPPKTLPADQRSKPNPEERNQDILDELKRPRGTCRFEERIEQEEFVMRWRAATAPARLGAKEGSGIVLVDLESGKFRTQPLEKGREIEAKLPASVEWNGLRLHVGHGKYVGDWAKTLPASRSIVEGRYLLAVETKTNKVRWERTLQEWGYTERKRE